MNRSSIPGKTDLNAVFGEALRAHHAGQLDIAAKLYRQVLSVHKTQFDTLHMLGVLEGQRGNVSDGVRLVAKAVKINPKSADAHLNLGRLQGEMEDFSEAERSLRKALALGLENELIYCNLSAILNQLHRPTDALDAADRALSIAPFDPRAQFNRANALYSLRRYHEAEAIFSDILMKEPANADGWLKLAKTQARLNKISEATPSFEKAAQLAPSLPGLGLSFGQMLSTVMRHEDALRAFDRELMVQPNSALAWFSRGDALRALKRFEESIVAYDTTLRLDRKMVGAAGARVLSKMAIFDWKDIELDLEVLFKQIRKTQPVIDPLGMIRLNTTSQEQLDFTRARMTKSFADIDRLPVPAPPAKTERIKIAYISSDFGNHPVAQLLVGALEQHDTSKFEIVVISTVSYPVPLYARIQKAAEHFVDASEINDADVARMMQDMNVQIAVDLNGHSLGARTSIFAYRPAPVQVNFLGYPGTLAADFIDYIIADRTVIPEGDEKFYSERVALMPDSFMPADSRREIATTPLTRAGAGLPEHGFVFCSFNDPYKITPPLFDIWMSLLRQVDGSVLWLRNATASGIDNLKREATKRGVDPARLLFAQNVDFNADHIARMALADLFLDTLPYNAHATASEALWAGLPVVTCLGQTFAGRVAASLLNAVGLPELVTSSWKDYEAIALKIARDPALAAQIKAKLKTNRDKYPLFDTVRYTRHLERAYTIMWEQSLRGEAPAAFAVQPD